MMRVCFCGDRNWINKDLIELAMAPLSMLPLEVVIVHGAAPGADTIAGEVAKELNLKVESFPAKWEQYGRAAGPKRNIEMLNSDLTLVFAFHNDLASSKGTKHMIEQTKARGIPVAVWSG